MPTVPEKTSSVAGGILDGLATALWSRRPRPPERQQGHLFIIGVARSGTTILQAALNHSPAVFLFGEPDIYDEPPSPGFCERYNAMHRAWRNQETKNSFCPPILEHDGAWPEYWERLGRDYRWIGAKTVTNPSDGPAQMEKLFAFHCRRFYQARYIFTFRRPLAVLGSYRAMQMLAEDEITTLTANMANYAEMAALYLRALRNLPHVRTVFHEDVRPETFQELGRWLDIPLDGAENYYQDSRVRPYDASSLTDEDQRRVSLLNDLYDAVRAASLVGGERIQLDQNDGYLSDAQFTPIGRAARKACMIATHFRQLADAENAAAGIGQPEAGGRAGGDIEGGQEVSA